MGGFRGVLKDRTHEVFVASMEYHIDLHTSHIYTSHVMCRKAAEDRARQLEAHQSQVNTTFRDVEARLRAELNAANIELSKQQVCGGVCVCVCDTCVKYVCVWAYCVLERVCRMYDAYVSLRVDAECGG